MREFNCSPASLFSHACCKILTMPLFPSGRQTSINDAVLCLFLRFIGPRQSNQIHLSYEREFPEERCESTTGKMCMLNRLSSFETNLSRRHELNVVFKGTVYGPA